MQFTNVKKGFNKIIIGEIIGVVSSILSTFAAVAAALSSSTHNPSGAVTTGKIVLAASIVGIISEGMVIIGYIILAAGLAQARKDWQ